MFPERVRFRDAGDISKIKAIQDEIEFSLRKNELFSGLRTTTTTKSSKTIPDNFTFRVFTQKEMQILIQKEDPQFYFIE